ncbi:hypothetical protein [Candidatus Epulonipiscium viviparus]|uniref:hypothetical protein n=1 Tax=Candidatus Epulonipiscium viviparus TaxID=420336 RepID=UPI00016C0705|nr:hypothetical protein [Candidatus Epulopiscium viviparus]
MLRDIAQAILQNEIEQARLEQFEKDMDKHTNVLESEEKVTTKGKLFHLGEKLASLTHREKLRSQETSKFRLRIGGPHIQRKNKIREPSIFSNLVYLEDYRGWRKTNAYI